MFEFRAILTYHSLDDSGAVISLAPAIFQRQMRSLFERGITVSSPEDLAAGHGLEGLNPALSLTFDDGFSNFYTKAFPALAEYRIPATVFLVAGAVGTRSKWADQPASAAGSEILCWSRVEELRRAGVRFGAHTMTHPRLTDLPLDRARAEVLDSKKAIEDRIGGPVTAFAYPYGAESEELRILVGEHFEVGLSTRMGYLRQSSRRESLERIDVYYLRSLFWYRRLFRRVTGAYLVCRSTLRGWKHSVTGPS